MKFLSGSKLFFSQENSTDLYNSSSQKIFLYFTPNLWIYTRDNEITTGKGSSYGAFGAYFYLPFMQYPL